MVKHLTTHGNSLALVIEKGVLDLLGIGRKTPLNISTDGNCLIISPPQSSRHEKKFHRVLSEVNKDHAKTLQKLASDESFVFTPREWKEFLSKTQKEPVTRVSGKEAAMKHLDRLSKK